MSNDIHGGREPHENCSDPTAQLRNGAIRRAGPRRAIPHAVHVQMV